MVRRLEYNIEKSEDGKSIATFLKEQEYSQALVIALKKTERGIRKNGEHVFVNEILRESDLLEICMEEEIEEGEIIPLPYDLQVLYEDEDILVVNKPHDMPIHPSINNYHNTLANAVAYYFKQNGSAHVFRCINRLDRDTSGATMIAKNPLSAGILSRQVKERRIHRTYVAMVEGITKEQGIVDLPIGRKEGSVIERKVDHENGKRAVTHYRRLDVTKVEDKEVSLLSLKLETGRTHQIRVHMSYLGHPLLGDFLYNKDCDVLAHQALHSAKLVFNHPITGKEMSIKAPVPIERWKLSDKEGVTAKL